MNPKRLIFRTAVRCLEALMRLHKISKCYYSNLSLTPVEQRQYVDIITVAFNNDVVIDLQIKYLRKYMQDEYVHIVADNSSDKIKSEKIRTICENNGVGYVRLPKNHLNLISPSYSHAAALNYCYYNIITKRKPNYFAFIDHDIFPIAPTSIIYHLKTQPFFGALRHREGTIYWYLSAVISFFNFNYVYSKHIDFMPIKPDGKTYLVLPQKRIIN